MLHAFYAIFGLGSPQFYCMIVAASGQNYLIIHVNRIPSPENKTILVELMLALGLYYRI